MRRPLPTLKVRTLCAVLMATLPLVCRAAQAQAPAPDDEDLEINVQATPHAGGAALDDAGVAAPAPPPTPALSAAELDSLRARVLGLEQRLVAAEAKAEDQESALAAARAEEQRAAQEQRNLLGKLAKLGVSISGYLQLQYGQSQLSQDQLLQGGTPLNQDRFAVRRGRLRIKGRWQYVRTDFEFDASTTRGPTASVRRAYVAGQLPSKVDGEPPYLMLGIGLSEIPFGLELQQGQDEILFLERTAGSLAFFPGPVDTGAKLEAAYGPLRLQLAIMNGAPLDDRAGGPSAVDPTRAPDYVGRVGVDTRPVDVFRIAGGVSFLSGTGFHAGSDATKPVLQWADADKDGQIGFGELSSVAGRAATPSKTFEHWAVGADLAFELTTKAGASRLYGELILAENLDRALFVADPVTTGLDMRELNWYVAALQDVTRWAFVGARYDVYDPNSDLFESRRGVSVPRDAKQKTLSPVLGARWPGYGRLSFEYDWIRDKLARDRSGVPTDVKNNAWTLRVQGEF